MTTNNPRPQQPVSPYYAAPLQQRGMVTLKAWLLVILLAVALIFGIIIGNGSSGSTSEADIKDSETYKMLEKKYQTASKDSSKAKKEQLDQLNQQIKDAQDQLDKLTGQVNQAKKNTFGDGTWTVGTDIEAGTYRSTTEVGSSCYWGITAGGSNGEDIIANDITTGGYPQITVHDSEQLKIAHCRATFTKVQ